MTSRLSRTLTGLCLALGVFGSALVATPAAAAAPTDICHHDVYGGDWYCGYDYEFFHFRNGVVQIFVIGTNFQVYTKWKRTDGTLSSWVSLGGQVRRTYRATDLRPVINCHGQPTVEVIGTDSRVYGKARFADGTWDSSWRLDGYLCP